MMLIKTWTEAFTVSDVITVVPFPGRIPNSITQVIGMSISCVAN
jgi:hypothetical protein